ncbi:hypothetical protein OOU_Y34scaffold00664g3 [Pyricularia oryzae Y34]|uniref:Uncharacterized protein n=1 Tax=Pyricularia oryzae (strain Y34) TaxID=1143189 RepID=A0AA97NU59_PYRO3|nr:hypothetical protein OOU_Y34scaffold00664g3 [Pyricularia oryzae Y34]
MAKLLDPDGFIARYLVSPEASVVALLHRTVVAKSNAEYQAGSACDLRGGEALHTARCYVICFCYLGLSQPQPTIQAVSPIALRPWIQESKICPATKRVGGGENTRADRAFSSQTARERYHMLTLREGRFTVRGYGVAADVVSMYRLTLDAAPYPSTRAARELRWSEQKRSVARHCCV